MIDEFPWRAGGSGSEPTAADRDPFRSLGLEFTEESPTIAADETGWLPGSALLAVTPTPSAIVPAAPPAPLDAAVLAVPAAAPAALSGAAPSTDPAVIDPASLESSSIAAASSRRALREAERGPAARRSRRASAPQTPSSRTRAPRIPRRAAAPAGAPAGAAVVPAAPTRPASPRVPLARRIAKKTFPPAVMLAAAALLVGTSVPANALFDPEAPPASLAMSSVSLEAGDAPAPEGQVIEAEAAGDLAATAATRDDWSVTSYAELLRLKYGNRSFSYSTSGTGAVRWPFPYAVPISSGFGERVAPCRWCSSYHQGLDFNPGAGTPIYAIADGVVIQSEYSGGFGQHAIIEHVINGQRVTSTYAHMTGGSSPLVPGQQVLVGDFVGTVGSTGTSTGAHLHFEIRIDDIAIDPFQWLQANAS